MKKLFGLGKGLGSLIPASMPAKLAPGESRESVFYVETNKIKPDPKQPRRDFDEAALAELASSIRKYGILQPLLVTKEEKSSQRGLDVEYVIVAGERRWRAARLANLPQVPVIVKDSMTEDKTRLEISLIENLQREDLNLIEEAQAFSRLHKDFGYSHDEIARRLGRSRPAISNAIRLLGLPSDMQESLRAGRINFTQARALLAFTDPSKQKEVYKQILAGEITSTMDLGREAPRISGNNRENSSSRRFEELEGNLAKKLGGKITITHGGKGVTFTAKLAAIEDLNKLVKLILD